MAISWAMFINDHDWSDVSSKYSKRTRSQGGRKRDLSVVIANSRLTRSSKRDSITKRECSSEFVNSRYWATENAALIGWTGSIEARPHRAKSRVSCVSKSEGMTKCKHFVPSA